MGAVLAVILVIVCAYALTGPAGSARRALSRTSRTGSGASARQKSPRPSLVGHWIDRQARRQKAFLDDWTEERKQGRKTGTHTAPPVPPRQTVTGKVVGLGTVPPQGSTSPAPGAGASPATPSNGSTSAGPQRQQPGPQQPGPSGPRPAGPQTSPPQQGGTAPSPNPQPTGGSPVSTSSGPVEQMVEGINGIRAQALSGGIHAKHAAVKSMVEACERFAAMTLSLARELSEPGMHYGPEITEPLQRAGQFLQAAAAVGSESDASLSSLKGMTVGDLAQSARQAPDHSELSETGSR